jgi:hypothetical protein
MAGLGRDQKRLLLGSKLRTFGQRIGGHQDDAGHRLGALAEDLDGDVAPKAVADQREARRQTRCDIRGNLLDGVAQARPKQDQWPVRPEPRHLRHEAARIRHEAGNQDKRFTHKSSSAQDR